MSIPVNNPHAWKLKQDLRLLDNGTVTLFKGRVRYFKSFIRHYHNAKGELITVRVHGRWCAEFYSVLGKKMRQDAEPIKNVQGLWTLIGQPRPCK